MQKEFEEAAFKLNKGEVSGIVDTASGVHLIQRLELHVEARMLPDAHHGRGLIRAIYDKTFKIARDLSSGECNVLGEA
jgi:hypothetical protein